MRKGCTLKKAYKRIRELARPYLDTRKNDIHTEISTRLAYLLLELEGGMEEVVIPAILLHDVGWKEVPEDMQMKAFGPNASLPEWNRVHEVEGARIAGEILAEVKYDPEKVGEILRIIEGHDSRKEPFSLNDTIVKDADKLWRYDKEAVEINSDRFQLTCEEGIERLRVNIEPWFLTDSAKKMAREEIEKRLQERGNRKDL
ncbi:MAG TPA: HD domain-containing protein [Deltaproteobacteria bacterium]|nr:HD domain-containing protein [Deltaproteobacteria bacterium]HIJ40067.1 HD domain-containing protein [Deltaproteobacteria bacterium]